VIFYYSILKIILYTFSFQEKKRQEHEILLYHSILQDSSYFTFPFQAIKDREREVWYIYREWVLELKKTTVKKPGP
jgi:hypothetical protein